MSQKGLETQSSEHQKTNMIEPEPAQTHTPSEWHESPLVSVVIPCFNHERFVHASLESVANQDYQRIELILIDDGSTDQSFQIAKAWQSNRAKDLINCTVIRQANSGICKTLNRGIRLSKGSIVCPLASDDMLHPGAIIRLVEFFQQRKLHDALVITNVSLIDLEGETFSNNALQYTQRSADLLEQDAAFLETEILLRWGTPYQHQAFTRKFYDDVGGYREDLHFEDIYFALIAASRSQLYLTGSIIKKYRVRPGQSITPGLTTATASRIPSRVAARAHLGLKSRITIDTLNYLDQTHSYPGNIAARILNRIIYTGTKTIAYIRSRT